MSGDKQPFSAPSDEPIPFSGQDHAQPQSQIQAQSVTAAATSPLNVTTQRQQQEEEEKKEEEEEEEEKEKEETITHAVPKATLPGEQPVNMPSSPALSSPTVSQSHNIGSNTASPVATPHLPTDARAPQGMASPQQTMPNVSSHPIQHPQQQQQQHAAYATRGPSGIDGSIGVQPVHAHPAVSSPLAQSSTTHAMGTTGANTLVEPVQPVPQQPQQSSSPMIGVSSPYAQQHHIGTPSQQPGAQTSVYTAPYQHQQPQHHQQQQYQQQQHQTTSPHSMGSAMASSSNAVEPSDGGSDPQVQQWTSAFWRNTGRVQSALGEWTGLESWRNAGQSTEQWAEQNYADAKARAEAGQASRLHGEYERMMGMLGTAMGHVAGDPEMEAKARLRARQGQEEIDETRR